MPVGVERQQQFPHVLARDADAALCGAAVVDVQPYAAAASGAERAGPVEGGGARLSVVVDGDDVVEGTGEGLALEAGAGGGEADTMVVRQPGAGVAEQTPGVREREDPDGRTQVTGPVVVGPAAPRVVRGPLGAGAARVRGAAGTGGGDVLAGATAKRWRVGPGTVAGAVVPVFAPATVSLTSVPACEACSSMKLPSF